ncbi:hypothetical protein HMPREF1138_1127 [Actinomyces sp. ICM58]|nr:hypothetical protein HMPREF1138_1127 [Actinomyces sp. ICM58]
MNSHRSGATRSRSVAVRVVGEDVMPVGVCCSHPAYSSGEALTAGK